MKKKNFYRDFIPEAEFDFHEHGILHKFEIEKLLENFLEDSYAQGYNRVLVITGKGQVVRPLVDKLLSMNLLVESYQSAGYFNGQDGAYEVYLK